MHNADYSVARLSVRLAVTRRYSVETAKHVIKVLSPSGSRTVLVFFVPNGMVIFRREPPPRSSNGGVECKGHERNRNFRQISRFNSKTIQDKAIVTMEGK